MIFFLFLLQDGWVFSLTDYVFTFFNFGCNIFLHGHFLFRNWCQKKYYDFKKNEKKNNNNNQKIKKDALKRQIYYCEKKNIKMQIKNFKVTFKDVIVSRKDIIARRTNLLN